MQPKRIEIDGKLYDLTPVVDGNEPKGIISLKVGDKKVDIGAKVEADWGRRSFVSNKTGKEGAVHNLLITDGVGKIKLVCWDARADDVKGVEEGDELAILNGYVKQGQERKAEDGSTDGYWLELHVGEWSQVAILPKEN